MKYKKQLRQKIDQFQALNGHVTLGLIAAQLSIEPSYLSRFLGDTQTHFSDDLLYRLAAQIGMSETEIDALLLLRDYDRASHPARKKYLELKIRSESLKRWSPELEKLTQQLHDLARVAEEVKSFAEICMPPASHSAPQRPKMSETNKENPMKKTKNTLTALLLAFTAIQAQAAPTTNLSVSHMSEDNRAAKKIGAYIGILGDPHPTILGFNVAYNVLDYMRASIGFGKITVSTLTVGNNGFATEDASMTTIGAAAKFMVPQWNLTPTATVGYSHVSLSDRIATTDYKSSNIYLGLGGDWQAESGFNLGAGMNLSLNSGAPSAPYINVGMFF